MKIVLIIETVEHIEAFVPKEVQKDPNQLHRNTHKILNHIRYKIHVLFYITMNHPLDMLLYV